MSIKESQVFEEGWRVIYHYWSIENKENALDYLGKRLGVTLSFVGSGVAPDYYFADTQLANAPGYPKFNTHVYVRKLPKLIQGVRFTDGIEVAGSSDRCKISSAASAS